MLVGSLLLSITWTETTRYVHVWPFFVVTLTRSPRCAPRSGPNAPRPAFALSTWPAINVDPVREPGVIPSSHQPNRWISGGTSSAPFGTLILTGKTGASMSSDGTRTLAG